MWAGIPSTEILGELSHHLVEGEVELLQPARDAHSPPLVPEVTLELADDGRGRVGREFDLALRSKRSMAFRSPIVPTWIRSSSGSPRLRNRRARYSTSGRCRPTSSSRNPVLRVFTNFRNSSLVRVRSIARSSSSASSAVVAPSSGSASGFRPGLVGLPVCDPAGVEGQLVHAWPPHLRKLRWSPSASAHSVTSSVRAVRICQAKVSRDSGSPRSGTSTETSTNSSAGRRW